MANLRQIFAGIFNKEKHNKIRKLVGINDLQLGDFVEFTLIPQSELANKRFEVNSISGYDFDGSPQPSFTLQSTSAELYYLALDASGLIAVSKLLPSNLVTQALSQSAIDRIFSSEHTSIDLSAPDSQLKHWLAPSYTTEHSAILGYYQEKYAAGSKLSDDAIGFDYYSLVDKTGKFVLEIEVYDGGETEFYCTVLHHKSVISSMWPGNQ